MAGDQPLVCSNCAAPLYAQWWDKAAGGYRCRVCQTLNAGLPSPGDVATTFACSNCGATLYAQWWDAAAGGYRCRVCGTVNHGDGPRGQIRFRSVVTPIVLGFGFGGAAFALLMYGTLACMDASDAQRIDQGCNTMFAVGYGLAALAVLAAVWLLVVIVRSRH